MRYFSALLCCLLTFSCFAQEEPEEELILSTPDQLATLTNEPSYLIGGFISPLGGHPSLRQTDLIAKGAQNVSLTRIYIPPYMPAAFSAHAQNQEEHDKKNLYYNLVANYKGWQFSPHLRLQFNPKQGLVRLSEPSGATFDFRISGNTTTLASLPYAISNTAGDEPGGRYDPRNTRISYLGNGSKFVVYATDGTIRHYDRKSLLARGAFLYLLQKEVLPNGKVLRYRYNDKSQPISIESMDPRERHVYAFLTIEGSPKESFCHFTSSSGVTADYSYQRKRLDINIKEKIKYRWFL